MHKHRQSELHRARAEKFKFSSPYTVSWCHVQVAVLCSLLLLQWTKVRQRLYYMQWNPLIIKVFLINYATSSSGASPSRSTTTACASRRAPGESRAAAALPEAQSFAAPARAQSSAAATIAASSSRARTRTHPTQRASLKKSRSPRASPVTALRAPEEALTLRCSHGVRGEARCFWRLNPMLLYG